MCLSQSSCSITQQQLTVQQTGCQQPTLQRLGYTSPRSFHTQCQIPHPYFKSVVVTLLSFLTMLFSPDFGRWGATDTQAQLSGRREMLLHEQPVPTPATSTRAQPSDLSLALKLSHKIPPSLDLLSLVREGDSSASLRFLSLSSSRTFLTFPPGNSCAVVAKIKKTKGCRK